MLNKKFIFILLAIISISTDAFSQQGQRMWVYFTDKGGSEIVEISPDSYLSQAALDRRKNQKIDLDFTDLPVHQPYINEVEEMGFEVVVTSRWLNAVSVRIDDSHPIELIDDLSFVKKTESVLSYRMPIEHTNFQNIQFRSNDLPTPAYGMSATQIEMIGLDKLHEMGYTGEGLAIAVLDGGFRGVDTGVGFQSFWDKEQILATFNFADNVEDVFLSSLHGTYVLSIMGADMPGKYIGASPEASFYLLRTEVVDSERVAEEDFWLAAAEFADFVGADIINSSLGYTTYDVESENHTYADMDGNTTVVTRAADMAASKGILVCNSAGNSGNDSWRYIGAPADGDSVFTIGAVDSERIPADFSSEGPTADGRVKPNISVMGDYSSVLHPDGVVYVGSGTSFSSPLAAGAAACLWQAFPEKTNWEIMEALQKSASRANNPDYKVGYGIPNMVVAYHLLKGTDFDELTEGMLSVFPNPVRDASTLVLSSTIGNGMVYRVTDMSGRIVEESVLSPSESPLNLINLNTETWTDGAYIISIVEIQVDGENLIETTTIIKQ